MKFKKLLILISIVAVLFVLVVGKNINQKKEAVVLQKEAVPVIDIGKDLSEISVFRIVFYRGSDEKNQAVLSKDQEGRWVLDRKFGARVRQDIVSNLLKDLKGLKGELRGESRFVFDDFGIADSKGVHLILSGSGDKVLNHLILSEARPQGNMMFAREAGSEKIALVDRDILSRLGLYSKDAKIEDNYFIDFKMVSAPVLQAEKIEISGASAKPYALVKKEADASDGSGGWGLEPLQKVVLDLARVNEFLQNVANLYAQDVMDPVLNIYGLQAPSFQVTLKLKNEEKPLQILVGNSVGTPKAYYVKILPQGFIYKVPEASVLNLKKDKAYFFKPKDSEKKK